VVDRDTLSARLNALEGYLAELDSFRPRSREEFVREPGLHHLAERFLHLACECVLDTAHHVIADLGYRQPSSYKDTMEVLREQGLIDADHGRSHDAILHDLGDLRAFAAAMAKLLDPP
jgi:uncharacterized protein YutE (UPF0331/DUF86 family)